jgi:hypothetical protein
LPRKQSDAEHLLILSLALEDAVVSENWEELDALFTQRANLLQAIDTSRCEGTTLALAHAAGERAMRRLSESRQGLLDELSSSSMHKKAAGAYAPTAGVPSFDGTG